LEGFGAHFRRDFGLKNGPVFDLVFGMVFPHKKSLKLGEKVTKIYEKGIPKTDPQKDKTNVIFLESGYRWIMKNNEKPMVFNGC
jgi:hypothetical protein